MTSPTDSPTDTSTEAAAVRATPVRYAVEAGVATITLNRPDAANSLDLATKEALRDAVAAAAADDSVRCVLLTGAGDRAFCAGQDLREHVAALRDRPLEEVWSTVPEHYIPIARGLATMPKPVVAAVNGVAAGAGAALAFACDFRVLSDTAGFNLAFTAIGLSCDTGTSWTLPRLVGHARAVDLLMRPRTISAEEAERIGLATSVVPAADLAGAACALARELAAGPTVAYAAVREALAYASHSSLEEALEFEGATMRRCGATADHANAVAAFVAKRRPEFEGR
ncbi:2-(1,2-epoxy-1,2-dihydrophenyl)acetyl-CoA isomerase [Actinopolymorpha cephalotaxi]|uniref:2-(1,2-epoxy-1,2-dihydrophenyl)acetyl-CoA isomerase n=1 Tax=Actinopolymorpha cephalotaxi TaxID=504797 RepID=A0A1I2YY77_9ACTN|nr:enoyl-CoA hydratase-related protein [Actinopolymorpha cephalotaxi]NYH81747.1 2-(1,2-epoxy-1,2-dihydrophenyl)acetyl-CoA isomerase [Actinopolymorpha cephalotaxi]SFH30146.1 2-(1,2-epoxy-1,2-dihydrophenyl)acetyl-CoA isomerase [Actinopolymorpha cephalotaxi]